MYNKINRKIQTILIFINQINKISKIFNRMEKTNDFKHAHQK
jgi:hypothetical protein